MANRSLFCLISSRAAADMILHRLKEDGCDRGRISVLFRDGRRQASNRDAGAGPAAPSSTEIRGVMAWIAGIGPVVIQDDQALIVAGPLAGAFHASSVGGIAEGLVAFGLPSAEARRYEQKIKEGQILVSVHGDETAKETEVLNLFTSGGASEILQVTEAMQHPGPLSLAGST